MINFKVRLRNKTFLMLFIPSAIAFIYTAISMFNIVPRIAEDDVVNLLIMLVELLSMLGIVNDPTTKGMADSKQAMNYETPKEDSNEEP